MRKVLLLTAAALLVPGVAFADGEEGMAKSGWFYGGTVGWTNMNMPEHGNAALDLDFGGGLEPVGAQADVDGVSYGLGVGRESEGGWRTVLYGSFFSGDGSSTETIAVAAGTPSRRGTLAGLTQATGATAGPSIATNALDVRVDTSTWGVTFGRALVDMLRADLVVSYNYNDTAYRHNTLFDFGAGNTVTGVENTDFETRTVEIAGRMSVAFPLSSDFSVGLGGSAGWGMRDIEMTGRQQYFIGAGLFSNSSIAVDGEEDGFIGRLDASLAYNLSPGMNIALTANYVSDSMVPVFVGPVYPPAGTGTAATFETETQSTMTYGLRLLGRF